MTPRERLYENGTYQKETDDITQRAKQHGYTNSEIRAFVDGWLSCIDDKPLEYDKPAVMNEELHR